VHLVASSVPELNTKAVSVVDGNGALLWPQDDRNGAPASTRPSCAT
jgi:flagellar biosynthesis/type III secretory pathway M-ring protein FliF/YscJ